jgi:hypothetical protein
VACAEQAVALARAWGAYPSGQADGLLGLGSRPWARSTPLAATSKPRRRCLGAAGTCYGLGLDGLGLDAAGIRRSGSKAKVSAPASR